MKNRLRSLALLLVCMAATIPAYAAPSKDTVAVKKSTKRKSRKKKQESVEQTIDSRYANIDLRDIADMSLNDYLRFASDPNNLKAVQESVKGTIAIMHKAMKEARLPEDQIGLIDDIPEVDEIIEKNGKPNWLGLPPKVQKSQIGMTDTNIKTMFSRLLDGGLPTGAYAEYQRLLAEKKIQFKIIPLIK